MGRGQAAACPSFLLKAGQYLIKIVHACSEPFFEAHSNDLIHRFFTFKSYIDINSSLSVTFVEGIQPVHLRKVGWCAILITECVNVAEGFL